MGDSEFSEPMDETQADSGADKIDMSLGACDFLFFFILELKSRAWPESMFYFRFRVVHARASASLISCRFVKHALHLYPFKVCALRLSAIRVFVVVEIVAVD